MSEKRGILDDPLLRDMGETEKPGTMMGTQPFIRDDHLGSHEKNRTIQIIFSPKDVSYNSPSFSGFC